MFERPPTSSPAHNEPESQAFSGEEVAEIQTHLEQIKMLLSRLVESGSELDSVTKQSLRAQLVGHCEALGLPGPYDEAMMNQWTNAEWWSKVRRT